MSTIKTEAMTVTSPLPTMYQTQQSDIVPVKSKIHVVTQKNDIY